MVSPMSMELRRFRRPTSFALAALIAGGAWWGAQRLIRGNDPMAAARSAYLRRDWSEAHGRAREVLRSAPADPEAIRLLARSFARLGRDQSALDLFGRLSPEAWEAEDNFLLAGIFARHDRPELSRAQLWKAYHKDPKHAEALHALVRSLSTADALAKAVELAVALEALPGWQARGAVELGRLRAALDDPAGAALALQAALNAELDRTAPTIDVATVRKLLARQRLAQGHAAEARAALAALDDPEARWLLGRADLQEGKPGVSGSKPALDRPSHEPAPYIGAARCAPCHASIARRQNASHHARTFWAGTSLGRLPLPKDALPDPANPAVVHTLRRDGEAIWVETRTAERTYRALVAYAFGSGDRGLTPVGRDEQRRWRELRMSRFADGRVWDLTSGHDLAPAAPSEWLGKTLSADELRRCIGCHATALRAERADAGPFGAEGGIGCERCHGPGGNHVNAVAAGLADLAIARPKLVSGEQPIIRLCGQCHSPRGLKVSPSDPGSIRFQATTLTWSRCYTQSADRLDCVTCHDPHRDAETAPAFYEAKCLDCHGPLTARRCPVNPTRDCIGCHMPTVRRAAMHSTFTDHHIRIHARG
jgi:hypothetical protein